MYLRKMKNKKTGRIYLSIVHSYRDKVTKTTRSKTIKSLGYLDDLEKQYDDPITFFTAEIQRINKQQDTDRSPIAFSIDKGERIQTDEKNRKNLG
ncbi:hypothetical protein EV207_113115, partial [Scopulibacillus darangshiensis]